MTNLKVKPEQLTKVANQLDQYNSNFNNKLKEIKATNSNLSNVWKGNDASKYIKAIEEQAKTMDDLYKALVEISQYMKQVSKTYTNVMNTNINNIKM